MMTSNAMRAGLAAAALVAASLAAHAADRPVYKALPPPAPMAPIALWTGFYVGINGGGAWGSSSWDAPPALDFSTTGSLFGLTAGYNMQVASWVFGIEGDYDWTRISGSTTCGVATASCSTSNSWLATFRGRIGYAVDRVMPYFTGGLAWGDIEASNNNIGFGTASSNRTGWTVGGGLEFLIANNFTAKVEYLYVDLGSFDCGLACNAAPPDNVSLKTNIFRAGLNYKIDMLGGGRF